MSGMSPAGTIQESRRHDSLVAESDGDHLPAGIPPVSGRRTGPGSAR
jgi:hypothetical protein